VGAVDMGDMNNKIDIIINNERKVKNFHQQYQVPVAQSFCRTVEVF
jgi:hypothetical protein